MEKKWDFRVLKLQLTTQENQPNVYAYFELFVNEVVIRFCRVCKNKEGKYFIAWPAFKKGNKWEEVTYLMEKGAKAKANEFCLAEFHKEKNRSAGRVVNPDLDEIADEDEKSPF